MKNFYRISFAICVCIAVASLSYTLWLKHDYDNLRDNLKREAASAARESKTVCVETGAPPAQTCIVKQLDDDDKLDWNIQEQTADWTFGTLLVGIVGALSGLLGLFWIRQTLLAANRANEISREAFVTGERAWIFTEIQPDGESEVDEHGNWNFPIVIVNTNYGKTVGLKVHSNIASCPMGKEREILEKLCEESRRLPFDDGVLLAPGETFRREWKWGYQPGEWEGKLKPYEYVARMLVGCVTYETPFGTGTHQTAFVYIVEGNELKKWSGGFAN
nr:hypothetical protein [Rhizobium leguminosarum]